MSESSSGTGSDRSFTDPAGFSDYRNDMETAPAPHPRRRGLRVGTIVWGLVLISLACLLLAVRLTDIRLDAGLVVLGLTIGAGTALVVGGLISALDRRS